MLLLIATLVASTFLYFALSQPDGPRVQTTNGEVVGLIVNHSGTTGAIFKAFIGIPYGDPPVRFQLAKPKSAWNGSFYAQKDGPPCPQPYVSSYSEDCLYLNVYTPLGSTAASKLPVFMYVHGGVFTYGSSSSTVYGPDFFIGSDIIIITINYRLGAIGFLTLGSRIAPGNLGLHDTLLALQWIQKEIVGFGGDPLQVTIAGHSAGGMTVHYHYISPLSMAAGALFNKAIAMSGPGLSDCCHISMNEAIRRAHLLAQNVNCDISIGDAAILKCLQRAEIQHIVGNQSIPMPLVYKIPYYFNAFVPVIDNSTTSDYPFFNNSLEFLTRRAVNRSIPIIMGFVTDEGVVAVDRHEYWKMAEHHTDAFIPISVMSKLTTERTTYLADKIRNQYFRDTPDENKVFEVVKLHGDTLFVYQTLKTARYYSNNTYGYIFNYYGSWRLPQPYFSQFRLQVVAHSDELPYVWSGFGGNQYYDDSRENAGNLVIRDLMAQLFATFIKTGDPSNGSTNWKVLGEGHNFLIIDSDLSAMNISKLEEDYYNFWAAIEESALSLSQISNLSFTLLLLTIIFYIILYCQ